MWSPVCAKQFSNWICFFIEGSIQVCVLKKAIRRQPSHKIIHYSKDERFRIERCRSCCFSSRLLADMNRRVEQSCGYCVRFRYLNLDIKFYKMKLDLKFWQRTHLYHGNFSWEVVPISATSISKASRQLSCLPIKRATKLWKEDGMR